MIHEALLRVAIEFFRITHVWRQIGQAQTDPTEGGVQLPADVTPVQLLRAQVDGHNIPTIPSQDIAFMPVTTGDARWSAIDVDAGMILLWPRPDQAQTLQYEVVLVPREVTTILPDALASLWGKTLVEGALADLLSRNGAPWQNMDRAAVANQTYNTGIGEARRRAQSGDYTPRRMTPPPFV